MQESNIEIKEANLSANVIPSSPQKKHHLWAAAILIFIGTSLAVAGIYYSSVYLANKHRSALTYFEIKVVSPSGYPVVGSKVLRQGTLLGLTDSYGEWRSYLKLHQGKPFTITVEKILNDKSYKTIKNFVVPYKTNQFSALEVKGSVQLNIAPVLKISKAKVIPKTNKVKVIPKVEESIIMQSAPDKFRWKKMDYVLAGKLKNIILPAIKIMIKNSPIPFMDSPIKLSHLFVHNSAPLIYVEGRHFAFLKNYLNDSQLTAKRIYYSLKNYTLNKTNIFKSKGWKNFKLSIKLPKSSKIFLAGHMPRKISSNLYEYWGPANGRARLTLLNNRSIMFRRVITNWKGHIAYITLPFNHIAQRSYKPRVF